MEYKHIRQGETYTRINSQGNPVSTITITYKNDDLVQFIYTDTGRRDNLTKEQCKKYLR